MLSQTTSLTLTLLYIHIIVVAVTLLLVPSSALFLAPPMSCGRYQQSSSSCNEDSSSIMLKVLTPPSPSPSSICSRRSVFAVSAGILALAGLPLVTLADNDEEAAQKVAAAERMKQKIAASKLKYRRPTDLVKDRKANTDYSCVSATGSPCVEEAAKAPSATSITLPIEK
jgi:hypothetical protein